MLNYLLRTTVLQGGLTFHFILKFRMNGGDAYGKSFSISRRTKFASDVLTFGIFLLALLTFIFSFCK